MSVLSKNHGTVVLRRTSEIIYFNPPDIKINSWSPRYQVEKANMDPQVSRDPVKDVFNIVDHHQLTGIL